MHRRTALLALTATTAATLPTMARAVEEPDFTVERTLDDAGAMEVRRYAAYTVAEVTVPGTADEAGNVAFRILAGYIFGGNQGARKLEMTAPVTQAPPAPQKLAMTAPVTQAAAGTDGHLVQFVLPKGIRPDNAPVPNDSRIRIREVPARRVAVVRFSGFWSQANYAEHEAKLLAALRTVGLQAAGAPVLSRYDPPITPWFLRRNEIWIDLT
jgi:hypothetical protein